ncbi:RNA polymerase II-associated protein 3 [Anthonomus grandis grandis]|uniref:RNA polymerase II-associated protein 3 n=1 Tax=Anthonomus grandis grandis TaxID=2921223 RepID=UPI0021660753|nr:RNA polymerase II-associated protein 3 [Anthonomus grandis grandis]
MNPVFLQKQLRDNSKDLQDFCQDLKSWGAEMKRKEDSLKTKEEPIKKPKIIKSASKSEAKPKSKLEKIGSTDYAKWEKFDADLECERLEDDIKDDSELTDEFEESARDEALVHKEKGNTFVKSQQWDKAIESYTKAINCYAYDPVFYANRALCYLKKNSYIAASEDSTLALRLDGTYVKALQRRAAAKEALGKLDEASADLEKVLEFEPKNKESKLALDRVRKKLGEKPSASENVQRPVSKFTETRKTTQTAPKIPKVDPPIVSTWPDPGCEITPVKAVKKPAHLRSKTPLLRIEITETDLLNKPEEPEPFNKRVVEHKQVTFQEEHVEFGAGDPAFKKTTSAFKKDREKVNNSESKVEPNQNAWPKVDSAMISMTSDDLKIVENIKQKETKNNENNEIIKNSKEFIPPKTSVQFYSVWRTLKLPEEKCKFLKTIDPKELPNIFREAMESKVFSDILEVLSMSCTENFDETFEFLKQLTRVKRFSALTMFMESKDKNCLWKLVGHLRESSKVPKEEIDQLVLDYEL